MFFVIIQEPHRQSGAQQIFELGDANELYHVGYAKYEKAIKQKDIVPGGFDQDKGRQPVHFTLVKHVGSKNPNKKYEAYTHFKFHHDAIYVVGMVGAQKNNVKFHQMLNGCVLCLGTTPRSTSRKTSTVRDTAGAEATIRGAAAHIRLKWTQMAASWSLTRIYFLDFARENLLRDRR